MGIKSREHKNPHNILDIFSFVNSLILYLKLSGGKNEI